MAGVSFPNSDVVDEAADVSIKDESVSFPPPNDVTVISFGSVFPVLNGNLVAHFSADSITGVANGGSVATWTDLVNSIQATQTTAVNRPTLATNSQNGKPAVAFSGTQWLTIPTPGKLGTAIDSTTYTVLIAYKGGANTGIAALMAASAGGDSLLFYVDGTNVGRFSDFALPYSGQTAFSTTGAACWATGAFPSSSTGALQTFYVNGGAGYTFVNASPTTGGNTIGIGNNAGNNFAYIGNIYEILVWNVPLTPVQFKQATAVLNLKYGVANPWASVTKPIVFFGDSITAGVGAAAQTGTYPYQAAQSLSLSFGQWDNLGVGGISMANMVSVATSWVDPLPAFFNKKTIVCSFEWFNEQQGATPTDSIAYLAARKAIASTQTVFGTSTSYSGDPSATRNSYDSYFDTHSTTNIDSYVAIHLDPQIGTSTAFATHTTNFSDTVHLTSAGYTFLAADFVTGINGVPA